MRRIELARVILQNEETLQKWICPHCYHILAWDSKLREGFCPNEMCLNEDRYKYLLRTDCDFIY